MKRSKLLTIFAVLCVLVGCAHEVPVEISVNAKAAIIMEVKSGEILFEKNADKRFPPASTAKVMTAIVAIENSSLNKKIVPTRRAVKVEPTVAGLKAGVKYSLKDLLAAILIKSANDAARAIAESVAGTEKKFTLLMNAKAKEIGMMDTYFANASGLPTGKKDRQYTTVRDLAKLMRYARRYKVLLELMSKKKDYIHGSDGKRIYLNTHNRSLLSKKGASWGKTGYTKEARRTFVGIDPSFKPRIAIALLKSNDLVHDIAALKNKGLEIYQRKHGTLLSGIIQWVKDERQRSRAICLDPAI
jgi:D-alanyl-D-alanine carboxypeptidase